MKYRWSEMIQRTHETRSGLVIVTEALWGESHHRLSVEERKLRREDNRAMKFSREIHRKRKKHGRQ